MVGWSTLIDDGFEEGRKEHKVKKSRRDRL